MSEQEEAYRLAERLLDVPHADPDDELRMLARQLLRHRERAEFGAEAWAERILCVNLVGYSDPGPTEPSEVGNCFTVLVGGEEIRVVNFNAENLEKLVAMGLTWPVRCMKLGNVCVVHDSRIGERWYSREYCGICCPKELLTLPQQHRIQRDIMTGRRVEGNRMVSINTAVKAQFE